MREKCDAIVEATEKVASQDVMDEVAMMTADCCVGVNVKLKRPKLVLVIFH